MAIIDPSQPLEVVKLSASELQSSRIGQLLASKVIAKPLQKQKCGILPSVESAHPGYGWLATHGSRARPPEWHS